MSEREQLLQLVRGATAAIEQSRGRIDDLNVYPVPDGDTGTNLTLTARAVVEALEGSDASDRTTLAQETTRAALMGARGNSGVILSQIIRGAGDGLAAEDAVDGGALARVLRAAADAAYRGVREPVEGTMLTVIRVLAETAERDRDHPLAELLPLLVERGEDAVAKTPEQLNVLREAGVVDAGAAGLVELFRGIVAAVAGEPLPEPAPVEQPSVDQMHQEPSRYRYCTTFVIEGALDPAAIEASLDPLGDSLLVVGDESAVKAHVHTDDPGAALSLGTKAGTIANVEIADMHREIEARERRLLKAVPDPADASAAVVVVAGEGNRRLFASLGATEFVEGGQTMNPAAVELVAAAERAHAAEVVLLPNNDNVVLAAEQAAGLADKPVQVVPTTSIQAGLGALVAFDPARSAADNAAEMSEAAASVAAGAITRASRDVHLNGRSLDVGDFLGLVDGEPVTGGEDFDAVARAVVERLLEKPRDVLTLLVGDEEPNLEELLAGLAELAPELEIEVHEGGQPHYTLLIGAE